MGQENDELRYRFTAWMQVVVKRAKIDYIRRLKRLSSEVSIESKNIFCCLTYDNFNEYSNHNAEFEFDNDKLSKAFMRLSPALRKVLEMLFIENLTPEEIAHKMNCSIQHIYNQRSMALRKLREYLGE